MEEIEHQPAAANPSAEYERRLAARQQRLSGETLRSHRIGNARLAVFAAAVAGVWFFAAQGGDVAIPGLISIAVLVALFVAGDRSTRRIRFARRGVEHYRRALDRVRHRTNPAGETGARYLDPSHLYAFDLDIFGHHSVFQLLSVCRTRAGEDRLAQWLLNPAPLDEIASRHAALAELSPMLDLREDLAVLGEDFRAAGAASALREWAAAPPIPIPTGVNLAARVFSASMLLLLFWWLATLAIGGSTRPRIALIVVGLLEGAIFYRWRAVTNRIAESCAEPAAGLALLRDVLARMERETFLSPRLARLLSVSNSPPGASAAIAQLNRLIAMLQSRETWALRLAGPLVLWTTQVTFAIERWRTRHGAAIPGWLDAVAEFEALSSLAAARYEHPEDVLPQVVSAPPIFSARGIAHPLLNACVPNDLDLTEESRICIVSGSNMSGKSTLLRTVGVNAVLALAGAPVRAASLRISILHLGASIRTTDSLQGGISRFYAEILRLRQILERPAPVLFLLDELLAGTNSHDRRIGAAAILRGFERRRALGLVTTHDLALAAIADEIEAAKNVHFEDTLANGEITFDYKMRPGVVTRSNALELMRSIGLDF